MADPIKAAKMLARVGEGEVVLIGGVATFLHVQRRPKAGMPLESTHDADAALSTRAMGNLRDELPVTTNPRLHKEQILFEGVDVDLYPQFVSQLRFSYDELAPYAQRYRGFQIASIPHLLLLKLDAFAERGASQKGMKDRRDIAKLLVLLRGSPQARTLLGGLASSSDLDGLTSIARSNVFMELARGNAKTASELRKKAEEALRLVVS